MYLKAHGPAAITLQVPGAHTESPVCQIRAQAQLSIKWDWMVGKKKCVWSKWQPLGLKK